EELKVKRVSGGEFLFVERPKPGKPTLELAAQILPELLEELTFPRGSRAAGDSSRPIRWILALYGTEVIPFSTAGVAAGRVTRAHPRYPSPPGQATGDAEVGLLRVPHASTYLEVVASAHVVLDPAERRNAIEHQVQSLAQEVGGLLRDEGLLEEITYSVENPAAFAGSFHPDFLSLPRLALCRVLRQRHFFPLEAPNGSLLPKFIGVYDGPPGEIPSVRSGAEEALHTRLEEVRARYQEDRQAPLPTRVEALRHLPFHERLGSFLEKTERLVALTAWVCDAWEVPEGTRATALRAAFLCKADLATAMMREIPELKGLIGSDYARHAGEPEAVAAAIAEHYQPRSAEDSPPSSPAGRILSVADRIDTLVGHFAIGLTPAVAGDPGALRHHASALADILLDSPSLLLRAAIAQAYQRYGERGPGWRSLETTQATLLDFLRLHLETGLTRRGVRPDTADAILDAGFDDVRAALGRARALEAERDTPQFEATLAAAVRVGNILRFASRSELLTATEEVRVDLLEEEAERALYGAYLDVYPRLERAAAAEDYVQVLRLLGELADPIDAFFDEVLVMSDDELFRANRLHLLSELYALFQRIGEFTRLAGEAPSV
ncbi:MAG: glycine--tRNA ligase subunit beta, partial [Armatimonadota bacterium]|nr:glycine--tRNA ligase subunit beta [Armatimonadota bacterium]